MDALDHQTFYCYCTYVYAYYCLCYIHAYKRCQSVSGSATPEQLMLALRTRSVRQSVFSSFYLFLKFSLRFVALFVNLAFYWLYIIENNGTESKYL